MKLVSRIYSLVVLVLLLSLNSIGQTSSSPAPYCAGPYNNIPCAQAGVSNSPTNWINDFIDDFSTSGALTNISNIASGCNSGTISTGAVNYVNFCQHYLAVSAGQTIVCTMRSGIIFPQGFAIWVDWNQDNTFNVPAEYMGGTAGIPAAATNTTITFMIPSTQPNGTYRMRVRCAYNTNGAGITPCGNHGYGETEDYTLFVGPIPPNSATPTGTAEVNSPVCVGQALNFSLTTTYSTALTYSWSGPGGFSSTLQYPVIANASTTNSGVYTVIVSNSICPITRTVQATVVAYPNFTVVPPTYTICQGGIFNVTASLTANPALYGYTWTSANPSGIFNPNLQSTFIQPNLLPVNVQLANVEYFVTVSPTQHYCPITKSMTVTINNPLTPTLTMPPPQCDTFNPIMLTAVPGGGTWSANPAIAGSGLFTPGAASIGTNTVMYSVSVGTCIVSNTGTFVVSKFRTPALTNSISTRCVQDPLFNLMNIVQDTSGYWSGPGVTTNDYFDASNLATGNYSLTYHTFSTPDPNVCPSTTVLAVPVFDPPIPVIAPITPLCNTAGTVALTASPSGGVWSGNPGVSSSGVRTPSLNFPGSNNVVMYTAGLGTCVASSTLSFHMSIFNTASLTGVVPDLCVTSNPFNLMSIVQNTNGSWSGINVVNDFFNPSGLPTNLYNVVYTTSSTPNPLLCPDSRTISASVLNPATPNITQVGPFCNIGGPIQLVVTPTTGIWVSSNYLTNSGIYTPSLSPVGDNIVQYVIGTATCNVQQTKTIKTEAFVSAAILGSIPDLCTTSQPMSLSPLTVNSSGSWSGPGVTASTFDPAVAGAGTFTLVYSTASSPSGLCPDQDSRSVNVYSLAAPIITSPKTTMCNTAPVFQLNVSPVGGLFGSGTPGMVSLSGLFNPAYGIIGMNYVTYSIQVGPCLANSRIDLSIEEFISADFENTGANAYCKNNLPFNLNSLVKNPGGLWSSTNSNALTGYMFDPSEANIGENIIFYETNSASSLCAHTRSITILVKDIPTVYTSMSASRGCAPLEVVFNTPNKNSGNGVWNMSDGWEEKGLTVSRIFTAPGTYSVLFSYVEKEAEACSTQVATATHVVVLEAPKADFIANPEEVSISNPIVKLNNLSTILTDNKYQWTISGKEPIYELHPTVTFDKIGQYRITLMAKSSDDCISEIVKYIEVKNDFKIYVPNSFTPNYDGLNDIFIPVFSPYGLDSKSYELEIYDRWGHLVFQTTDITKGWDGTFKNNGDKIMKNDSYIYKIQYKDLEGKAYIENGSVSLLPN